MLRRLFAGLVALALLAVPASSQLTMTGVGGGFGAAASGCTEATTFLARTSGLDGTHTTAYTTLICGLVTDGLWSKLDVLYIIATQDSTTAALNLKSSSFGLTLQGSPTFTADRGYTTSSAGPDYLKTNYVPSTNGTAYTQNSASFGFYNRTASPSGGLGNPIMGSFKSTGFGNDQSVFYLNAPNIGRINEGAAGTSSTYTSADGFWVITRTGASATAAYQNGSSIATTTGASTGTTDAQFFIGTCNSGSGSACGTVYTGAQFAAAFMGGALNGTDNSNLSSRINAFMTTVGANVY